MSAPGTERHRTAEDLGPEHDPGPDAARARLDDEGVADAASEPLAAGDGHLVRVGTASWTDPTMTATGVFYPTNANTAEERLQHYAATFPLVEVDATYYALPAESTAKLWVERTPPDFVFDIKAHALMTGQGTETKRLPKALRQELPEPIAAKSRVYAKDLPSDVLDAVYGMFRDALEPLLTELEEGDRAGVLAAWSALSTHWGGRLRMRTPAGEVEGIAQRLDADGGLVLRTIDGRETTVLAGNLQPAAEGWDAA